MPDNVNRILTLYLPDEDAVVVEKAYGFGGGVDHLDESDMLSINGHSWRCESDMDDWLDSFWNLYGAGHGPNSNFMEQFSKYLHDCLPFGYGPSNKMADWMMIVAKKLKDYEKLKREQFDDRADLIKKIDRLEKTISANKETPTTDTPIENIESDPEALFQDAQNYIKLALERIDSLSEHNAEYGFGRELALAKTKLEEADLWLSGKAKDKYKLCI